MYALSRMSFGPGKLERVGVEGELGDVAAVAHVELEPVDVGAGLEVEEDLALRVEPVEARLDRNAVPFGSDGPLGEAGGEQVGGDAVRVDGLVHLLDELEVLG